MPSENERQQVFDAIVKLAKSEIEQAGARSVDAIAKFFCGLLTDLGAETESEDVYQHYSTHWSGEQ